MEKVSPHAIRELGLILTSQLCTLEKHYRSAKHEKAMTGDLVTCLMTCFRQSIQYENLIHATAAWRDVPAGCLASYEVCEMILDQGLDQAVLKLLQTLMTLLQCNPAASSNSSNSSSNGGSSSRPTAAPGGTSTPTSFVDDAAALLNKHMGVGSLQSEIRPDFENLISIVLNLFNAMTRAASSAGLKNIFSAKLATQLLSADGKLLIALETINQRMLLYLLHTKVLRQKPVHTLSEPLLVELCDATMKALHVLTDMTPAHQHRLLRNLPPTYLDTACRCLHHSLQFSVHNDDALQNYLAISTLPGSKEAISFADVLQYATEIVHDPGFISTMEATLHSPCMQRMTHLTLMYLIPRTAVGPTLRCADDLVDRGRFPSPTSNKRYHLLNIRLLFEIMLGRLDRAHATQTLLNCSSSSSNSQTGMSLPKARLSDHTSTSIPSLTPDNVDKSICTRFQSVWGCAVKEDKKLLLPKATNMGAMIVEIVRIAEWEVENWGSLCCRLVSALLRACEAHFLDSHMQSELGRGMLAVARLATMVSERVMRQQMVVKAEETGRKSAESLIRGMNANFAAGMLNSNLLIDQKFRKAHNEMAVALKVLVMQMLRVGKFCNEGSWQVTGVVGPFSEGGWLVTLKNLPQVNWVMLPGSMTVIEMGMRQMYAATSLAPGSKGASSSAPSLSDLTSLIQAHRGLLQRTWIGFMAFSKQEDSHQVKRPENNKYFPSVAGNTVSLTRTFCKLLLLAAGLASHPDSQAAGGNSGSGPHRHSTAKSTTASRSTGTAGPDSVETTREAALLAEEVACVELQQFVRVTRIMFTGAAYNGKGQESGRGGSISGSKVKPGTKSPLPRNNMDLYMSGKLLHATSLRLMLMLGRCCAVIAVGNRKRGWYLDPSAVVRLNSHTDVKGNQPEKHSNLQVLTEAGSSCAAADAHRYSRRNFALTLRSGTYTMLHSEALRASGFNVAVSEPLTILCPAISEPEFECLLTLTQSPHMQSDSALQGTGHTPAVANVGDAEMGAVWERFAFSQLTRRTFPGCHDWGCGNLNSWSEGGLATLLCSGCKRARYCSVRCQRAAWSVGGHAKVCLELSEVAKKTVQPLSSARTSTTSQASKPRDDRHPLLSPANFKDQLSSLLEKAGIPTSLPETVPSPQAGIPMRREIPLHTTANVSPVASSSAAVTAASPSVPARSFFGGFFSRKPTPTQQPIAQSPAPQHESATATAAVAAAAAAATASGSTRNQNTTSSNAVTQRIVHVTSSDFIQLEMLVHSSTVPTTFDLGGRIFVNSFTGMCHALDGAGHFDVPRNGICLRNGTLKMGADDSNMAALRLSGQGIVLENVHVIGGCGIQVMTDAEVILNRCSVSNAHDGICTFTNYAHERMHTENAMKHVTRLTAQHTTVHGCKAAGLRVERCSKVDLSDCKFSGGRIGITVTGNSATHVQAKGVECVDNSSYGVKIGLGAQVVMDECKMTGNVSGAMDVDGQGTRLSLSSCRFDGQVQSTNGGKVEVRARVFESVGVKRPATQHVDDLD